MVQERELRIDLKREERKWDQQEEGCSRLYTLLPARRLLSFFFLRLVREEWPRLRAWAWPRDHHLRSTRPTRAAGGRGCGCGRRVGTGVHCGADSPPGQDNHKKRLSVAWHTHARTHTRSIQYGNTTCSRKALESPMVPASRWGVRVSVDSLVACISCSPERT